MAFFNKQRMSFLKTKKIKNYLAYAFGEIILVVLGILIAVGINSFNQQKQLDNSNLDLKNQVIVQLEKDISNIETYLINLDSLQESYLKVLNLPHDSNKIKKGSMIATLLINVNTISLRNNINNLIDNATLNNSKTSQELIDLSSSYKLYVKNISGIEDLIFETVTNNLKEIEKTQDWYVEFITEFICRNDCINYLLNNQQHKSRMASIRFLYVNVYGRTIKHFKNDLERFLKVLKSTT